MRSWILLNEGDADLVFWNNFDFPINYFGESAYEVRCGSRGRCKHDWDRYIEKTAFQIFYNPWTNMFRVYLSLNIPKCVKIIDPDELFLKNPDFLDRIERFYIERRDFKHIIYVKD